MALKESEDEKARMVVKQSSLRQKLKQKKNSLKLAAYTISDAK